MSGVAITIHIPEDLYYKLQAYRGKWISRTGENLSMSSLVSNLLFSQLKELADEDNRDTETESR